MKLIGGRVERFGKLSAFEFSFQDGLNVLLRENGWGKTTLAVFIKAMLFGLSKTTKRRLDENERKKYTPWQGGAYGGELVFSVGEREYRIERFFGDTESEDTFALYDHRTNLPSEDYGRDVGEKLFGLNAAAYERSTYFSQRGALEGDGANSINAKLNGLLEDNEDIGAFDEALKKLTEARRIYGYERGTGGKIEALRRKAEACELRKGEALDAERRRRESAARAAEAERAVVEAQAAAEAAERDYEAACEEKNRLALRETYRELLATRRSLEEEFRAREAFFRAGLPTDAEIAAVEAAEAERNRLSGKRSALELSCDAEELFASGVPTDAELDRYEALAKEADAADGELRGMQAPDEETALRDRAAADAARREAETYADLPDEAEAEQRLLAAQTALSARAEAQQKAPDARRRIGLPALLLCILLAGAGAACIATALPAGRTVLFAVGLSIAFAALCGGIVAWCLTARADRRKAEALAEAVRAAEAGVAAARQTLQDCKTANYLRERIERLDAELAQYERYCARKRIRDGLLKQLGEGYRRYRVNASTWSVWVRELRARREAYEACLARREEAQALDCEIEANAKIVSAFLQTYGAPVKEVRDKLREYAFYRGECEAQREKIARFERERGVTPEFSEQPLTDRTEAANEARRRCRIRVDEAKETLRQRQSEEEREREIAETLPDIEAELSLLAEERAAAEERYFVLKETAKYLEQARSNLSARYLSGMQRSLSGYLAAFGGEKLGKFDFDANLEVVYRAAGKKQDPDGLSKGYRSVLSLCTRFALVDVLFEGEKPFLMLDDPFADLDGTNLEIAKRILRQAAERYQILYFVCHTSRQ